MYTKKVFQKKKNRSKGKRRIKKKKGEILPRSTFGIFPLLVHEI
jgi:hypothetical protein